MALTLIVFAGFYPAALHTVRYADALAQALHGNLVLLHVNRASLHDPYAAMDEHYHQEELASQTDTAAALQRLAGELPSRPTVEVATDLLPALARDLVSRHRPALFVLSQPDYSQLGAVGVTAACASIMQASHFPLLVVTPNALADRTPRRVLIAADREDFTLGPDALPLHQLLGLPGVALTVAFVSRGLDNDAGCAAAMRAVQLSGLVMALPTPELRGYSHDDCIEGLLLAVRDTQADLVVVLARRRSNLGELFHRSVTAHLLERCPVPVLVLPVAARQTHAGKPARQEAVPA